MAIPCSTSVVILTEVKVIDESGNVVPVGTPGELCTRAYSSMLCYWNDEEKTNELISKDRWLHSGYVLGCANKDLWGLCAPISIIVVCIL